MLQDYLCRPPVGQHLNTAFVERQNGTMHHQNRRFTRKTRGFSKKDDWMDRQLAQSWSLPLLVAARRSAQRDQAAATDQGQWFTQKVERGHTHNVDWHH